MDANPLASRTFISPSLPYDFGYALTYFTRRAGELVDRAENGCYRRLFLLPQGPTLAELRSCQGGGLELLTRCAAGDTAPDPDSAARAAVLATTVTRTLGLQEDLAGFRAIARCDPPLAAVVQRYAGLRLISTPSAFEAFVWAVIGQQISLHVAFRLKAALVKQYGVVAEFDGGRYWSFPTPQSLAAINPAELAALGLGRRKAATIVQTASGVASGHLDLECLTELPLPEAEAALVGLHGVGPWTARYTLLRGLRVADACPVSDMGLRQACGVLYGLGRNATAEEVAGYAERWRPYRGYAAFYLWFMLTDARSVRDG